MILILTQTLWIILENLTKTTEHNIFLAQNIWKT